jgi:hypothetical protein
MGTLRDLDRLPAAVALVLTLFVALVLRLAFLSLAFLSLVLGLAFRAMGLVLLALLRVLAALLTERRSAGFSGVVTDGAAGLDPWRARLRPSPVDLASWDRCSE